MSPQQKYKAPSVRQLAAVVERVAPRDRARWDAREKIPGAGGVPIQVSEERGRQLWMVVDMFGRAVGRDEMPGRSSRTMEQMFTWAALRPFWELAAAGELRKVAKDVGKPLSLPTLRIVRDCLGMLAGKVVPGKRVRLPRLEQAQPKETVRPGQLTAVYRELVDLAGEGPLERDGIALKPDERTRLLAMVAVVLDAAPRSGEMEAMTLADVGPGEEWLRIVRRPQNAAGVRNEDLAAALDLSTATVAKVMSGNPKYAGSVSEATRQAILNEAARWDAEPVVERYELRPGTRVALRRWLRRRAELVYPLEGSADALWVTIVPSKAGPPGVSIRAQGILQSYTRGMTALNMLMAGSYGWEPMPTTLEQLRRSVTVEPLEEE
jgi:hypothetical protein